MTLSLAVSNEFDGKYYSVRIDKKSWSKDPIKESSFTDKGYTVKESRRGDSDKDVFAEGKLIAKLFIKRSDALKFIES
jgi:hypothetical protein